MTVVIECFLYGRFCNDLFGPRLCDLTLLGNHNISFCGEKIAVWPRETNPNLSVAAPPSFSVKLPDDRTLTVILGFATTRPRGPTPAGILYKLFGISNGIWNLALESRILRLKEILQIQEISGYLRILL